MSQEQDLDDSDNYAGQHQHQHQYYDSARMQSQMQSQVVPQQPLHMQQYLQQHQQQQHQQHQPQSLIDENNSSSLVYDRTIKVPKTGYADHGTHGVAAFPLPGHNENNGGLPAHGSLPSSSSVQMQLQMQQMAAARNMLQQQHQQQQQQQQYQMMPPPSNSSNGMRSGYPSLVPGSMGSHPFYLNNTMGGGGTTGMPGGANSNAPAPIMNTTSSVGLMQALNAQMAANQQAAMTMQANHNLAQAGGMMNAPNNLSTINNLSTMVTPGGGTGPARAASNPDMMINNPDMMIAPGDVRNGKKRVSPSVPLHPSQLQVHHGGVGMLVGPESNNLGMNSVAEEEEPLSPQQVLNSSAGNVNQVLPPQGLLGSALSQSMQHHQGLPQSQSELLASAASQQPQHNQQRQESKKAQPSAPAHSSTADVLSQEDTKVGEVLTNPSIPSANSGLDNAEGNLIVRRGDLLRIPRKNMHSHPPASSGEKKESESPTKGNSESNIGDYLEYKVVSLLGQGTFAQVFHCVDEHSKKSVAVKIVKNKPAYTRQAAVEIDVFRKLNAVVDGEGGGSEYTGESTAGGGANSASADADKSKGCSASTSISTFSSFDTSTHASTFNNGENAIIRLMSYFMYSSHLCLVFEMLGPNLYELLKKRQFRGLPMGAVRTLIRQATEGIKLLGRRNVVHCDLKPENILMVRSEDLEGVIAECKSKGEQQQNIGSPHPGDGRDKSTVAAAAKLADPNTSTTLGKDSEEQWIKLIDFGSACFEGQTTHTYIQSRFYRSPEVLIGLPYDSAIDIWSLGCVAAELFLGLPILPGVHEHDQLGRILEMIGPVPDWMLEQGSKSGKFFKNVYGGGRSNNNANARSHSFGPSSGKSSQSSGAPSSRSSGWEFKTRQEYINFLTEEERRSKGGLSKLEQQQTNRYFKKKKLEDIVMHHGVCNTKKEREQLGLFVHFLKGVLDPDPWKRWTAHQASMHPFLTGSSVYRIKTSAGEVAAGGAKPYDIHWVPPWDASISRRKLMVIQKTKEKNALQANNGRSRRQSLSDNINISRNIVSQSVPETSVAMPPNHTMPPHFSAQVLDIYGSPLRTKNKMEQPSPAVSVTSQMAAMADAMSLERARSNISSGKGASPPQTLINGGGVGHGHQQLMYNPYPAGLSASLGGVGGIPLSYQQLADVGAAAAAAAGGQLNLAGRSFSDGMHPEHIAAAAQQHLHTSLSNLNDVAFLQPPQPPPPTMMGAQSFSGAYYQGMPSHYPYVESELGYALQRPGVVPGMGSDAYAALRRQSSNSSSAAMLAQQQSQMLSASLSNLSSSTPQNYGVSAAAPAGPMNYQSTAMSMSPGGLLLQKLGLQEQMLGRGGGAPGGVGGAGTSLLAQQLEEYSQSDHQQGQGHGQQHAQQVHNSNNPLMGHQQQSFSNAMLNSGSYHGEYEAAPSAVPMSLTSLPYIQSTSFSDFGNVSSSLLQQQQQQQHLAAQLHPQLQMNASFPVQEMMYPNGGSSGQNDAPNYGQSNHGTQRRA